MRITCFLQPGWTPGANRVSHTGIPLFKEYELTRAHVDKLAFYFEGLDQIECLARTLGPDLAPVVDPSCTVRKAIGPLPRSTCQRFRNQ